MTVAAIARKMTGMPEAARMRSERFGRIVEDSASEVYLFGAEDFRFVLVNRGARENLGYSLQELGKLTPWDIKPAFSREEFIETVEPLLAGTTSLLNFETIHERKDGTCYDVAVHLQLMRHDGEAVFYAAIRDVTELKRTQRKLEETSWRLDAILDNTTMAVFMMDERQHCVFMNAAAEELTGYTFAETRGSTLHDIVHHTYPDGRPFPIEECAIDRAFPENNQTTGEEVFVHKDGSFYPVGFTASPMKDKGGTTIGTIIEARNIADEIEAREAMEAFNQTLKARVREAIEERKKLEAQLVQAQKMEAVGQLTGGVAHDFNNLLQVIGGNLQLLEKDLAGDERKQKRVHNALAGVRKGAKLASQLLAFGRQQPLDPKPINVGRLVRGMDDMFRRTLGETIEIETVISGGLWNCLVDPAQMENVLLNLAINARDAMDGEGKLTIEAGNASLDDGYATENPDVRPGQYVMVAVTDTGGGIPADVLAKVFDPFFTTKETGKGTGLGLSMVYGFVKQSAGHVKIYSEEGEGTTVRIYLPKTRRKEEELRSEPLQVPQANGNETILIVEDDDAVRATSVELLSELGYAVLEASNADNALAIVNSGVKIDLLFTDVVMPGELRSPELARRAKQKLPMLQVLFTSGYTQNAIVHAGRLDEGVELLAKPFTRERLAQKIRAVLALRSDAPRSGTHLADAHLPDAPLPDAQADAQADAQSGPERSANGAGTDAATASGLRILVVEDEVLIRMTLCEMLEDEGHAVVEAGSVSAARKEFSGQAFDVIVADLGLPDGSGVDLVREALEQNEDVVVVVASGRDARDAFEDMAQNGRIAHITKPYEIAGLRSALMEVQAG